MSSGIDRLPLGPDEWDVEAGLSSVLEYDGERVAEEVVWPLADEFSRRDWKERSVLGEDMRFPERGTYKGRIADVVLLLEKEPKLVHGYELDDEDELFGVSTATLSIAVKLEKEHRYRKKVLEVAKHQVQQAFEGDPREYNEAYTALQATDNLIVSQTCTFMFDSEGNRVASEAFDVKSELGGTIWGNIPREDVDPEVEEKDMEGEDGEEVELDFATEDMKLLTAIVDILQASSEIKKALHSIFWNPRIISTDDEA